jgi:hypothetical protein
MTTTVVAAAALSAAIGGTSASDAQTVALLGYATCGQRSAGVAAAMSKSGQSVMPLHLPLGEDTLAAATVGSLVLIAGLVTLNAAAVVMTVVVQGRKLADWHGGFTPPDDELGAKPPSRIVLAATVWGFPGRALALSLMLVPGLAAAVPIGVAAGLDLAQPLQPVAGGVDPMPAVFQDVDEQLTHDLLVVHDQDPAPPGILEQGLAGRDRGRLHDRFLAHDRELQRHRGPWKREVGVGIEDAPARVNATQVERNAVEFKDTVHQTGT